MISIFFIMFLYLVNSKYIYKKTLSTPFNSQKKTEDFLKSKKFIDSYLKKVNAKNITFKPELKKYAEYPFTINYNTIPRLGNIPNNLEFNIEQNWSKKDNLLIGNVKSKILEFGLKLSYEKVNNTINIHIDSEIIKKSFYLPSHVLKSAIDDFCNILTDLMNNSLCFYF